MGDLAIKSSWGQGWGVSERKYTLFSSMGRDEVKSALTVTVVLETSLFEERALNFAVCWRVRLPGDPSSSQRDVGSLCW
jgi:hypothetical protein